ncbi:YlxR family protein [Dietzia sp.]|uniref:YlxR family protein n=1 Tax=Dietzia sp. TaxID=1871616 RepID=UPI002FD9B1D6
MRTCVGCRTSEPVSDALLRVVAAPGGGAVLPDRGARAPGRGAWVHLDTDCLRKALERKAFPRALRLGIDADVSALHGLVAEIGDASIPPASGAGEEE